MSSGTATAEWETASGLLAQLATACSPHEAFDRFAACVCDDGRFDLTLQIEGHGPAARLGGARWSTLDAGTLAALDGIGFGDHDPVHRYARRSLDPFLWTTYHWPGPRTASTRHLMRGLKELSLDAGISVAVWGRGGRVAIATLSGRTGDVLQRPDSFREDFLILSVLAVRVIERLSLVRERQKLTARELEILELAAQGFTTATIARQLSVVEQTVKFHFRGILEKLNVRSRAEAIARFSILDAGAITPEARSRGRPSRQPPPEQAQRAG